MRPDWCGMQSNVPPETGKIDDTQEDGDDNNDDISAFTLDCSGLSDNASFLHATTLLTFCRRLTHLCECTAVLTWPVFATDPAIAVDNLNYVTK